MESPLSYSLNMIYDLNTTLRNRGRVQAGNLGITQPFSLSKAESGPPETFLVDIFKIFQCVLMSHS